MFRSNGFYDNRYFTRGELIPQQVQLPTITPPVQESGFLQTQIQQDAGQVQPSAEQMMQPVAQIQPSIPVCPFTGMPLFPLVSDGPVDMTAGGTGLAMPSAGASPLADPPPVLSNNPTTAAVVLFKELTGYPNYGNPSGNADILYTGTRGVWTFNLPPFFLIPGVLTAQLVIRAVLDDHYNVPESNYSATITVNGVTVHRGRIALVHGRPAGSRFNNWRSLVFNVFNLRRNNQVIIENTSNAGADDWIGLDWMEIRLSPR